MRIMEILSTVGAFALTVAPAFAEAATSAAAPVQDGSNMGGGSSLLIIALVVALGVGIYFIARNNNNKPKSP